MDNFNVQIFSQPNNQGWQTKIKKFLTVKKTIYTLLGIALLVEIIFAIKTFSTPAAPLPSNKVIKQQVSRSSNGKILLTTTKPNFKVTEVVPILVKVNTGIAQVSGIDLILKYDPKILEASAGAVVAGQLFDEYPVALVDNKKGLISVSGISNSKQSYKGEGKFASINFRAKAPGKTALTIDYKEGSTSATNMVDAVSAKNILKQVYNLELNIQ